MDCRTHETQPAARLAETGQDRDAELVGLVAGGDRHAFEVLYRAYFPRLTRFLHRMTRSVQLIEEIVNDVMLVVWQKADSFDGSCKVSTWIFAIAYRKACKMLHKLDDPLDSFPDALASEASCQPERRFEQLSLAHALGDALDTLPLAQRAAFQLTFYHDMSCAEIADIMDCPVNTVKTRLFHARRRLALLFEGQLEGRP
ncbi:RNA polymerase sigma factor [Massilia litorea]|uniref:RNA polymerase sigma factor n=1 Tax=Massilia litorea TaxID=2769491 RepID=UPI001D0CF918|nr:sigma-70 family RNA polymerase sigma factor [Massilia litorea]